MRRLTLLTIAFATLLATPAFAAPPKACDLLSSGDAAKVWGGPVTGGVDRTNKGLMCQFDSDQQHDQWVMMMVADASAWGANSQKIFDMFTGKPADGTSEPLAGLGEAAKFVTTKDTQGPCDNIIVVLHHGAFITFTARRSKNPHIKDDMIQATRKMLAKF